MSKPTVICFGEVLWDLLPDGKIAGGAPMNVACHVNNFGIQSKMISRVGSDDLGLELLHFLKNKGVDIALIQQDSTFPTGVVNVTLTDTGQPSYEIVQRVAWDYIQLDAANQEAVAVADALVFGSLACRTDRTRNTLLGLLEEAPYAVFDINLRPPFYSQRLLEELLEKAALVKMNDEELDIVAAWYDDYSTVEEKMHLVSNRFALESLVLTQGAAGALLLTDGMLFSQKGFPVKVQDTIGSGDTFLAGLLYKKLSRAAPQECLEFACGAGALVASLKGGTPTIDEAMVRALIEK
ncbi:MAG TPA: carbohydrate kinase [Saprospiraceae bacterium]|nr:carbohydrate kinase [Saprospiraceae bacterium]HMQ84896.1 carbohydrate kinase [Saprospiraceae bacterium]